MGKFSIDSFFCICCAVGINALVPLLWRGQL